MTFGFIEAEKASFSINRMCSVLGVSQIWLEADVSHFRRGAPIELQRALILALHTGQR